VEAGNEELLMLTKNGASCLLVAAQNGHADVAKVTTCVRSQIPKIVCVDRQGKRSVTHDNHMS